MKWSEMSKFQKIASIVGYASGIVYVILAVLVMTGILPNTHDIARIFLGVGFAAISVQYWKSQRAAAILWLVLGVANIVISIVSLLT